ncbi:dynactin subunit 5 [Trichodelitschia bisporula]|uniref:Dynactin subunit 5 n=1 Tax=Trichodelitschia bisporula TaxID=703511 RepID=A0A6G1HPE8_9PEZI|nr:dynactin subunit 5 [Trichodelitschia bisporula]
MSTRTTASRKVAKGEYIETDSGNKVSRRANISGTANITLGGKTVIMADVHLRGDLTRTSSSSSKPGADGKPSTSISIGRCTVVSTGTVVKPPMRMSRGVFTFYPLKIGDNVFIGPNCHIQAASISSHVHIGAHAVLQPFVMVRENVKILPHSVVPAGMIIPPNSVVAGRPARIVGEVGEGWGVVVPGGGGEGWVEGGDLRELVRSIR